MRDPDRIRRVLEAVERVWEQHPDWRLGQFIENLAAWADDSVWNIEDDALVNEIQTHLNQLQRTTQMKTVSGRDQDD